MADSKDDKRTISKTKKLSEGTDYDKLYEEGFRNIQFWASDDWTDYNEHDPGITILQQLCYALTDLGYRTEYSIPDILASQPGGERRGTFYTAAEILPCGPVTLADYRKLIINEVPHVINAWVEPIYYFLVNEDMASSYIVFLEVDSDKPSVMDQAVEATWNVVNSHRNLTDEFKAVKVLEQQKIKINARIEISPTANPSKLQAELALQLSNFMTQPIRFFNLPELLDDGMTVDEVFDGPPVTEGFILDDELHDRTIVLYYDEVINQILSISGVISVQTFSMETDLSIVVDSGEGQEQGVLVGLYSVPVLDLVQNETTFSFGNVSYMQNGVRTMPDPVLAGEYYKSLQETDQQQTYPGNEVDNDIAVPEGKDRHTQNGMAGNISQSHQAQIKQLKAYLLFFEQLMADFQAQLANVDWLFSLDRDLTQTYFVQPLEMVPGIQHVVKGMPNRNSHFGIGPELTNYQEYVIGLEQLNLETDDYYNRRYRMLNHLMARFAEQISRFPTSETLTQTGTFEQVSINTILKFLRRYVPISRMRGYGYDYRKPFWNVPNISGMERRVKTILGIPWRNNLLSLPIRGNDIHIGPEDVDKNGAPGPDGPEFISLSNRLFGNTLHPLELSEEERRTLDEGGSEADDLHTPISKELIQHGMDPRNYAIAPDPREGEDHHLLLLFRARGSDYWSALDRFKDHTAAHDYAVKLMNHTAQLNEQSEGFYVVEHILLRPETRKDEFGFQFHNSRSVVVDQVLFRSTKVYHFEILEDEIRTFVKHAREHKDWFSIKPEGSEAEGNLRYRVVFENKHGTRIGQSEHVYETHLEAEGDYYNITEYFATTSLIDMYLHKDIKLFLLYVGDVPPWISLSDFPFRISVVLPNWTASFSDQSYQKTVENLIVGATPAQVAVKFLWVGPALMWLFEEAYRWWLAAKQNPDTPPARMNLFSLLLAMTLGLLGAITEKRDALIEEYQQRIQDLKDALNIQ